MPSRIPESELLSEIESLASNLGKVPSWDDMREMGEYSTGTYQSRFGSWTEALRAAGLDPQTRDSYAYSDQDLIDDLQEFGEEIGRRPRIRDMNQDGPHAAKTYQDRFGSWKNALEIAGYNIDVRIETGTLLTYLQDWAEKLGRPPKYAEMDKDGNYSTAVYERRFGSWASALIEAGLDPEYNKQNPDHRIKETEVVEAIQDVADELGRPPTTKEMARVGGVSVSVCRRCFDTWNDALKAAGYDLPRKVNISDETLLEELREFVEGLDQIPTAQEMELEGPRSPTTYQNRFGSWNDAIREAGFEINRVGNSNISVPCTNCGKSVERQPNHLERFENHFCDKDCMGEWESEAFSGSGNPRYSKQEVNCSYCGEILERAPWQLENANHNYCDHECRGRYLRETGIRRGENSPQWEGGHPTYGEGWNEQKREKVREKYNRVCQGCGLEEEQLDRALDVHHVVPVREFEQNQLEANQVDNLVPLCRSCHIRWEGIPLKPQMME